MARDADGRWLAGRRADWVATWAGRWALGAGGSVEVGEDPVETLTRELEEEWSSQPERLAVEALVSLPNRPRRCSSARPGCPRAPRWSATPSTTPTPGGRAEPADWPDEADPRAAPHGHAARLVITFNRLKYLSFTHSAVYLTLLVAVALRRA